MIEFYRDLCRPEVERLAKAAARAHGIGDDMMVPETGYGGYGGGATRQIPGWWKFQEVALSYIAMRDADKERINP